MNRRLIVVIGQRPAFIRIIGIILFALSTLFLPQRRVLAQNLDLNSNGISDIWEQLYGAAGLDPNADTDGDGVPNRLEALAGTDPLDPNSFPRISLSAYYPDHFSVSVPSQLGKRYVLQSVQPQAVGGWTNWITEASFVSRTGTVASLNAPVGPAAKFFRVAISDVDTDGDGLNDWEEYQLGLDPNKASSNNQLDANGQPLSDYAYTVGRLQSQNVISITATDPTCIQPDAGQTAQDLGQFTVTRGGFPLNLVIVNLSPGGPGTGFATQGLDVAALPGSVSLPPGISSATIDVSPLANTNLLTPVVAMLKLMPGTGYTVGTPSNASVLIYPSQTAAGAGLTGQYYTNASSSYSSTNNFNSANLKLTRTDPAVDFVWGNTTSPITNNGYYCVRWTGQVQPQFSDTWYFVANTDDGVKLWVNDQLIIDNWVSKSSASDQTGSISLQGGVRYNIKMEYFQQNSTAAAHLSWYSSSQAKQIIPSNRFYPSSGSTSPSAIVSPLTAVAFLNQPFSFTVAGANSPTSFTASPIPPGLNFNSINGLLSGTPTLAGNFQILVTSSNSLGTGSAVLNLQVFDTGNSVVREIWSNAPGSNISDIPLTIPASTTNILGTLEGITNYGVNYGERIRGFLTAPATANYYFWIAGNDSAELWLSNDAEPANKVKRAYTTGTQSHQWNLQPNQKSGWLTLGAGQRYYIEILHKAGAGGGDNWSVGWLQDSSGTNNTPAGVVPGYVLSRYYPPPPSVAPGALYIAEMVPGNGVTNMPYGSATLRLNADNSQAVLNFSINGISSPIGDEQIENDPYLNHINQTLFDISATRPQPDGTYFWSIAPVGDLSAADVLDVLNQGKAYIAILTAAYPDGELIGHFAPAQGSTSFLPPVAPPAWPDDHAVSNAAARFLIQTTFGPSPVDIATVQSGGYTNWLNNQFALPASHHLPLLYTNKSTDPTLPYPGNTVFNDWWQLAVTAPDQLRQRVAFALSEILVVSDQGVLNDNGQALCSYYDTLLDNSFGNFRALLKAVTLTPAMGLFLNMQGNDKGSIISGTHANENYAREIMQLFSIGLYRTWPDGSLVMSSAGDLVPTYDQNVIMGFAATFTGWNYWQNNQTNGRLPTSFSPSANYTNPMVLVPTHHDLNAKLLLDNVMLPPALGAAANSSTTNFDYYCSQDLELALDNIFNNQNVGPFICRQLIQRLVTSQPSPGYLYRVVQTFNDNGSGVRGDMQSVLKAILFDYEARSTNMLSVPAFGKQREPLLRVTAVARAFPGPSPISGTYTQNGFPFITNITSVPHRLNSGDTVLLSFSDTSGQPAPASQGYGPSSATALTVLSPTSFRIIPPGILTNTYSQVTNTTITNMLNATMVTTNIIMVNNTNHGLSIGNPVYLASTSGGASNGVYQVMWTTNNDWFAVMTADAQQLSGLAVIHKLTGGGFVVTNHINATYSTAFPHGLQPGNQVYINFTQAGSPPDGTYQVNSVPDATHFTFTVPSVNNPTQNSATVYPLVPPPLFRSGSLKVSCSTWSLNATDSGGTFSLAQTPLNSPTVFNFFFPGYKFPGTLAAAGITTPEFQLTSDTTVAFQMNFLEGGILSNSSNTNGLSSFNNGGGAIMLDIAPWMTAGYTTNAALPGLVDALNSLLCAGELAPAAKTQIVSYASTLVGSNQARDRVRAVIHLIANSPDFTIQR